MQKTKLLFVLFTLLLVVLACNTQATPTSPAPEAEMTTIVEVVSTPTAKNSIPLNEAEVPRISLEKARAAIESGAAIVIDVRSKEAYAASHIPGALNIQLAEFETNPTGLGLDQDQWIITYCT